MIGSIDNWRGDLPDHHQALLDRFITACQADERIVAAALLGSYARGEADAYSDLDLHLFTKDEDFNDVFAQRDALARRLGEPLFVENFDLPDYVFCIFAGGVEVELGFRRQSQVDATLSRPYVTMLDKKGILTGIATPQPRLDPLEQVEKLRRLIYWFWHDLSHFIAAMGRGQLWWAQGQLEALRRCCINLARLHNNFTDAETGEEVYFKIDKVIPVERLADLQASFCALEADEMLEAAFIIVRFYQRLARQLAKAHHILYPEPLEQVMLPRLEKLRNRH